MLMRAWLVLSDMNDWARHHGRRQDRPCLDEACHTVWAAEMSNITKIIKSQLQQLKQERWYQLLWVMRDILFVFNWNINQLLKKLRRRQWDERGNEKGRGMIGMKRRGRGNSEYNSWTVDIKPTVEIQLERIQIRCFLFCSQYKHKWHLFQRAL